MMSLSASIRARLWRASQRKLIRQYRKELANILNLHQASPDRIIVFPPGLDWQAQLFQRPQHLAKALAKQGALVFYIQPEESRSSSGFHQEAENLFLCHVPPATFGDLTNLWVHSFTWNYKFTRPFRQPRLIYDFVDELDVFQGNRNHLEKQHAELLQEAQLVLVTAESLLSQVKDQRPDAILCPNGVDAAHFAASKYLIPNDMRSILAQTILVAGYYGALAKWFDYELLYQVAEDKPDWKFVLIGPDHDGSLPASNILKHPSIYWLGQKPYSDLPAYLAHFSVAMIPFIVNHMTHATSPLKLFEYMAGGKPVIVTPMQESMRYPGVLVAKTPHEFDRKLDQAWHLKDDFDYQSLLKETVKENSWAMRARQILGHLQ